MNMIDDGGPVFPAHGGGMTLRDWHAGEALKGMLAHPTRYKPRPEDAGLHWHDAICKEAHELADAMLAARAAAAIGEKMP